MPANDRSGRRWAIAALTVVVCLAPSPGAITLGAAPPDTSATGSTSDNTTDETTPDPPTPESTPPETAPSENTTPQSTTPTPSVVGGVTDTDDADGATTITFLAIIAAIALLGIAVWWMLRREDDGVGAPRMDDDWPNDSSVI
jgi:hypothetical protein